MKLVTLKKRRDFVLSNKHGQKTHNKNFILQEYYNPNISDQGLMFGFTATKRIGNAVKRNRAKRRMRVARMFVTGRSPNEQMTYGSCKVAGVQGT